MLAAKIPDSPLGLQNNAAITAANVIGLTWSAGIYNGGASVIDYTISYDQGYNSYKTLASGVIGTSYTATQVTAGLTFKFKI